MKIAGIQKTSFVDFPKMISCVVFTPGCNMRCSYCHNKHILSKDVPNIDELTFLDFLSKRKGVLKGVVFSGGEPTLQPDLESFIRTVKEMGFKVKLDTNGTNSDMLKRICEKGYVDYIAMDVKAPINKYSEICCSWIDTNEILESIDCIKNSGIAHEFRTTFCPELTRRDVLKLWLELVGDSDYYLQQYRQVDGGWSPHPREVIERTAQEITRLGGKCVIRGL